MPMRLSAKPANKTHDGSMFANFRYYLPNLRKPSSKPGVSTNRSLTRLHLYGAARWAFCTIWVRLKCDPDQEDTEQQPVQDERQQPHALEQRQERGNAGPAGQG